MPHASRPGPSGTQDPAAGPASRPEGLRRILRTLLALLVLLVMLALGFALGEASGWPMLIVPLQDALATRLQRTVQLFAAPTPADARLQFWGGPALSTAWLELGAPPWSSAPYTLQARGVTLQLRYRDLWRAWHGQQLRVRLLRSVSASAILERRADGHATWHIPGSSGAPLPLLEGVDVEHAQLRYTDALRGLQLQAQAAVQAQRLSLQVQAQARGAQLDFEGHADDLAHWSQMQGRFSLQGPSLAAVGDPLGITLPTTGAFKARGQLQHQDAVWDTRLEALEVGSSHLSGQFRLDRRGAVPVLTGSLQGTRLHLPDLGPAVGAEPRPTPGRSKLLPTRPFDLASLRAMQADVAIDLRELDTGSARLEPLRPLNARLRLVGGVLSLSDIATRLGTGRLGGSLRLDGQSARAHWVAQLQWSAVPLAQWIHQIRPPGQPPYVAGTLQGWARLQGVGRSTAEILASLQGRLVSQVQGGALSHLLLEAASLHLAETLGLYLRGDQSLPLDCAVADLDVAQGTVRPRVLVLDTSDSTLWLQGSLSLAQETLDLRAVVAPKDASPLSLRSPLHVGGSFAQPQVSVAKGPLGTRLGAAVLLGLLNPLAAWMALVDVGQHEQARRMSQACRVALHSSVGPAPSQRPKHPPKQLPKPWPKPLLMAPRAGVGSLAVAGEPASASGLMKSAQTAYAALQTAAALLLFSPCKGATMDLLAPSMQNLFAQLGEPNDEAAITRFIEKHGHLRGHTHLHEAPFWSPAQAAFLRDAIVQDANWAPVVDTLNARLHEAAPQAATPP